MFGFIKKDFFMIKSNIKILIILLFVYGAMTFQGEMDLSFLLPFMSVIIMISTFSYDTYNHWDAYLITLPDGRKNSVRSKYLATIVLILITTIIVTILGIMIAYIKSETFDFDNVMSTILEGMVATTFMQSFMYPVIYKFGVEKARIGIFVSVFGISILGGVLAKFVNFNSLIKSLHMIHDDWIIIVPIIMIIMLYISYKISERIYLTKEF